MVNLEYDYEAEKRAIAKEEREEGRILSLVQYAENKIRLNVTRSEIIYELLAFLNATDNEIGEVEKRVRFIK